jgi:hypothetical protein
MFAGLGRNASREGDTVLGVIPGRIEDASPESISPDVPAAPWIPDRRFASSGMTEGEDALDCFVARAPRNDGGRRS